MRGNNTNIFKKNVKARTAIKRIPFESFTAIFCACTQE